MEGLGSREGPRFRTLVGMLHRPINLRKDRYNKLAVHSGNLARLDVEPCYTFSFPLLYLLVSLK